MAQILFDTVVTPPPAPSAGMLSLYSKTDGTLWKKEPNGTETQVDNEGFAPLDSPVFIGDPRAPTPPTTDNDTSIATTAFVKASIGTDRPFSSANPNMDSVANPGSATSVSRGDHTHPSDSSKATIVYVDNQDAILASSIGALQSADAFNVKKTSDTGSANLPAGSEAQRDGNPQVGAIRFSSTQLGWEGWNGVNWVPIGGGQMLGAALNKAIFFNNTNIAENLTLPTGSNGLTAGPVIVDNGFAVTIENGSVWSIV